MATLLEARDRMRSLAQEHADMSTLPGSDTSTKADWTALRDACLLAVIYEGVELADGVERLHAALEELLDVAERIRGGDEKLDPERWYAARDFARVTLGSRP